MSNNLPLYSWMKKQRFQQEKGVLKESRKQLLEQIDFFKVA